jgi:large subunit ribosomal protein L22
MEVKSTSKYVPISPKKARDVARAIQGLPVSTALDILTFTPKKAAALIIKTLKTAIADAEHNFSLDVSGLIIKEAVIGAAPSLSRFRAAAKGSASPIVRRNSHIRITLVGTEAKKRSLKSPKKKAAAIPQAETPAESTEENV